MQRMLMNLGAPIERDSDGDGVNDLVDACEGTPSGLTVNTVDALTSMVMVCLPTLTFVLTACKWTIDVDGCASSKARSMDAGDIGNGPMDIVPTLQYQRWMGLYIPKSGLEMMSICLCSSIQMAVGTRIQQLVDKSGTFIVICLKTPPVLG